MSLVIDKSINTFIQVIGPMKLDHKSINKDRLTYFVDGGCDHFENFNSFTNAITVGDGDSIKCSSDIKFHYELNKNKDHSDLAFTFNLIDDSTAPVFLHGFSAGRFDHELINIFEAFSFLSKSTSKRTISIDDKIIISNEKCQFNFEGIFSLISLDQCTITMDGDLKYKLKDQALRPMSSHGLSNEAHGDFSIESQKGIYIIIFPEKT